MGKRCGGAVTLQQRKRNGVRSSRFFELFFEPSRRAASPAFIAHGMGKPLGGNSNGASPIFSLRQSGNTSVLGCAKTFAVMESLPSL